MVWRRSPALTVAVLALVLTGHGSVARTRHTHSDVDTGVDFAGVARLEQDVAELVGLEEEGFGHILGLAFTAGQHTAKLLFGDLLNIQKFSADAWALWEGIFAGAGLEFVVNHFAKEKAAALKKELNQFSPLTYIIKFIISIPAHILALGTATVGHAVVFHAVPSVYVGGFLKGVAEHKVDGKLTAMVNTAATQLGLTTVLTVDGLIKAMYQKGTGHFGLGQVTEQASEQAMYCLEGCYENKGKKGLTALDDGMAGFIEVTSGYITSINPESAKRGISKIEGCIDMDTFKEASEGEAAEANKYEPVTCDSGIVSRCYDFNGCDPSSWAETYLVNCMCPKAT